MLFYFYSGVYMIAAVNVYAGVQGEQRRMLKSQEMWLQVASSPQRWWKPNSSPLEEYQLLINADPSLSRGLSPWELTVDFYGNGGS